MLNSPMEDEPGSSIDDQQMILKGLEKGLRFTDGSLDEWMTSFFIPTPLSNRSEHVLHVSFFSNFFSVVQLFESVRGASCFSPSCNLI